MAETRIERDSMGEMMVPADAYYGAQTARAVENFPISGLRFPRSFIRALGTIKGYFDYGLFQAIQIAAIVALRHTEAAVEDQSKLYQARRDVLLDGLRKQGWQAGSRKRIRTRFLCCL